MATIKELNANKRNTLKKGFNLANKEFDPLNP